MMFPDLLANPYFAAVISLFLILYGALASPKLPPMVVDLFKNTIFRLLVLFLIAFMATKNFQVALMVAIVFLIIAQLASETQKSEEFTKYVNAV